MKHYNKRCNYRKDVCNINKIYVLFGKLPLHIDNYSFLLCHERHIMKNTILDYAYGSRKPLTIYKTRA